MKPDKKVCLNCGKHIDGRKTYCDDACRMAYKRNPNKANTEPEHLPEQMEPEQPNPNTDDFRSTLAKTDKTFYDRAIEDFGEPYYVFGNELRKLTCNFCGKRFETTLALNKYCSYQHYSKSLKARISLT